ncbi:manganese ABC transporter ATP-binding protein [Bellilinea caldifistulae]|uniref:Manganese ABC transporter ATP-binding protein n=1 Tax=Bellilinea caldifistulae TaxID=360411 RepID=A0A0P6X851_9CHLR|nr:manganese ABC transporter ATP-binding protein [Bellilinea caldifistulae]
MVILPRLHAHEAGKPILRLQNVTVQYESGRALDDITFELRRGERLAVLGPNGAGKSTLFKVIAGVLRPTNGVVEVAGSEPDGHICIAYVPQRSQVDWNFPLRVSDVVMMGRVGKIGLLRRPTAADRQIVKRALETVGMQELANRQIGQLSGGQQQRMFIARALAQEAELMLMDEPFTGLDLPAQEELFRILDALRGQGVTVMVALHDLQTAAERFDRVMLLNRRLIGLGTAEQIFTPEHLLTAYGGHLRLIPSREGLIALGDTCCDEGEHDHL